MISKFFLIQLVYWLFSAVIWIMFARIVLSFFPAIDWYKQPYRAVKEITDPILLPFRKLIPPLGGFDFSPIVAFLVVEVLRKIVIRILLLL